MIESGSTSWAPPPMYACVVHPAIKMPRRLSNIGSADVGVPVAHITHHRVESSSRGGMNCPLTTQNQRQFRRPAFLVRPAVQMSSDRCHWLHPTTTVRLSRFLQSPPSSRLRVGRGASLAACGRFSRVAADAPRAARRRLTPTRVVCTVCAVIKRMTRSSPRSCATASASRLITPGRGVAGRVWCRS